VPEEAVEIEAREESGAENAESNISESSSGEAFQESGEAGESMEFDSFSEGGDFESGEASVD